MTDETKNLAVAREDWEAGSEVILEVVHTAIADGKPYNVVLVVLRLALRLDTTKRTYRTMRYFPMGLKDTEGCRRWGTSDDYEGTDIVEALKVVSDYYKKNTETSDILDSR